MSDKATEKKLLAEAKKRQEEAEALELAKKRACEYIAEHEIYYVTQDSRFWKWVDDSQQWVFNKAEALRVSDATLRPQLHWEQFLIAMEQDGRVKETRTYSFTKTADSVLNMMREQNWLQPKPGKVDPFFDYMMTAISGGKAQNALHIKQLLGWKYLHPETWQLPSLAWYGHGGAGKNLFAEKICAIIFGKTNCVRRSFEHVKKFAESIAGKTVVFFDERPQHDDESILKFMVGSPTLSIEPKGLPVFDCENTAWYILATNGETGPVRIEKNGTDRRWSIIKTIETLIDVVMRVEGVDKDTAQHMVHAADAEVYGNPEKVAVFLNECIEEAKKLETFPHALHGEDYDELVSTQQSAEEELFTDIFEDPNFNYITLKTLHAMYSERIAETNPGQKPMASQKLNGKAMSYVASRKLTYIQRSKNRVLIKKNAGCGKSPLYYNIEQHPEEPKQVTDNSAYYLLGAFLQVKEKQKLTLVSNNILQM